MAWPQVCSSVQLHLVVSSQDVLCCFSFVDVLMVRVIVGEEKRKMTLHFRKEAKRGKVGVA